MTLPQYEQARELEARLGDPFDPHNTLSFRAAVEMDEAEAYPESGVAALNNCGMPGYYVPANLGGKFTSYEELLSLVRVVSRRDLTLAIAHGGTYLGAIPVWMAGDAEQQSRLAQIILGGAQVSLALTEQKHGSDLLAGGVEVRRGGAGYEIHGEKWLIGNATHGRAMTVLARTEPEGGPRGFTLLLLDKDACDEGRCRPLPKVRTHGVRGADISGVQFDGCPVPAGAFVGGVGSGLEVVLKALQVTRTLCPGFSLGAGDTALRVTLDFANRRRIYNTTVSNIPYPRELLLECFLDLLICECAATSAARALHTATGQMSVWSAVVKTFVPTTVEEMIRRLSVVLGARFYVREGHCEGIFQKILRDNAVVSLFDGSTAVNLEAIALQLRRSLREGHTDGDAEAARRSLALTFDLAEALPECRFEAFDLACRGADPVISTLPLVEGELDALCSDLPAHVGGAVRQLVQALRGEVAELRSEVYATRASRPTRGRPSARQFRQAQRFAALHTAASCLHLWTHSRRHLDPFFGDGVWLVLCLCRLLEDVAPRFDDATMLRWKDAAVEELLRLHRDDLSFSLMPVPLSRRRADEHALVASGV